VDLQVFALADGKTIQTAVYNTERVRETTASVSREADSILINVQNNGKPFTVTLRNLTGIASIQNGAFEVTAQGVRIRPAKAGETIIVNL
jgi:hypothetical protein